MKNIIVSEGVLSHDLSALCRSADDLKLYIHGDTVRHVKQQLLFLGRATLNRLIRQLEIEVSLTVTSPKPLEESNALEAIKRLHRIKASLPDDASGRSNFDGWLLATRGVPRHLAIQQEQQITATAFVTEDEKPYFEAASISCITPSEFATNGTPLKKPTKLAGLHSRGIVWEMISFLIVVLLGGFCLLPWLIERYLSAPLEAAIQYVLNIAIEHLPLWIAIVGTALYWLRAHERVFYGILECVAGGLLSYYTSREFMQNNTFDLYKIVLILIALYVVVSGLDNIGKGLSNVRLKRTWNRLFGTGESHHAH